MNNMRHLVATAICVAATVTGKAELPDCFVEYVQSDGTQYIDTGVKGRCGTSAAMTIQWMRSNLDASFLSSRTDTGNTRFILCSNSYDNKYYVCHRTWNDSVNEGVSTYNTSGPDDIISSITHDGTSVTFTMSVNGTTEVNVTREEEALDTGLNMYLFAQNKGGEADLNSSVRCYAVKIWQDDVLVRDFRPCVKDSVAGLYDSVSDTIFYPAAGTLAPGPVVKLKAKPDHFIQYVEATGTQYIDSEVIGRCNSSMAAHVMWVAVSDTSFLSSRIDSGATRFVMYGCNRGHYMAHRSYTGSTDNTWSTENKDVQYTENAPDYIKSSIFTNGTAVTYCMDVNGTRKINQTRTEDGIDTGLNMYVFAQNLGGRAVYYSKVRCFDLKIWQDDVLVRDFRPCIKDGRAGLYDEVSGYIFFAYGGDLVYPNETPDRYVHWANATGASYVPVAVQAKSGVRAEMKFRPMSTVKDQYFLAARVDDGATRFLLNYLYWKSSSDNRIAIGYMGNWTLCHLKNWSAGTNYTLVSEIDSTGAASGSLNGTTMTSGNALGAYDTGLYLYMFAINWGGNAQDYYTGRFYSTTIDVYDETAGKYSRVRDFKPCVKDGNVMFYDAVSKTMFKPYPAITAEGNVGRYGTILLIQ